MPFTIGENVGPYRVVQQLGQGGMATVYKAYHAALDRYVAMKVLHAAFLEEPKFLARFKREARVVAKLDHPNIVPIYDYPDHKGQPYLVMKFIEGETLKARLARGPLSKQEALDIIEAVGEALGYAHERGILHRDIKPSNILLSPDGMIYLADFGLARIAESGESTLSSDMMLGTPQYISPEQARGERQLDEGTDIYSFGVVLYEMVVGRVPFSADTPFSIIHDHIYTPLPMPRSVNPRVPEAAERVLLKALAKERRDRFHTVGEMVSAFRAAVAESTLEQIPDLRAITATTPATRPGTPEGATARAADVAVPLPTPAPIQPPPTAPATFTPPPLPTSPSTPSFQQLTSVTPPPTTPRRPAKQKRSWIWAAGGLGLTCLCLLVFAFVANRQRRSQPPASNLEAARTAIAANPQDADARMALATAYQADGQARIAVGEYVEAGNLYRASSRYAEAARAYAQVLDIQGGPGQVTNELIDPLMESLFLGAIKESTWALVESLLQKYPDWLPLRAVAARSFLQQRRPDEAMRMLDGVLAVAPQDPVANAVMAELYLTQGDGERAALVANIVRGQPETPAWLRRHLDALIPPR
jgi:serine/threonine protein kinase